MKHAKVLLQAEIDRLQKTVEQFIKEGVPENVTSFFYSELIEDYQEALKILNERNSVDEAKKSFSLSQLESMLDNALNAETSESLIAWIQSKRK